MISRIMFWINSKLTRYQKRNGKNTMENSGMS